MHGMDASGICDGNGDVAFAFSTGLAWRRRRAKRPRQTPNYGSIGHLPIPDAV
jgi:hypothetical protein